VDIPKPNLFIVGAPKCGTTAWATYLGEHPDVFFSDPKEPGHFQTDFSGTLHVREEEQYRALFREARGAKVIAEGTPRYLFSAVAADNIKAFNPAAKILIFLRDQADYLPSLHNQQLFNGSEVIEDFETAWRLSPKRVAPSSAREPRFLDYMAQGRFHEQVIRFIEAFGPEQVRVFHFDDWTADPRTIYDEILDFLGLEPDGRTSFPPVNEAARHRLQRLGRFTQSPPSWAIKASGFLKKMTSRERPPLVGWIRLLNRKAGYRTASLKSEMVEEIRAFYAEDNRLLEPFIWRPTTATSL
jgi:sulfotransferase family protein